MVLDLYPLRSLSLYAAVSQFSYILGFNPLDTGVKQLFDMSVTSHILQSTFLKEDFISSLMQ